MENRRSLLNDKAQEANQGGPVHRPGEIPGSSSSPPVEPTAEENPKSMPFSHPPPYSIPSSSSLDVRSHGQSRTTIPRYPGLPVIDYRQYSPPMFDLSHDTTTITSKAKYLSENVRALAALLRNLATVPPKPQIHVTGTRGRKVDFSIKLNLLNLLVSDDKLGRMDYLRLVNRDEMAYRGGIQPSLKPDIGDGGLEDWYRRFIDDHSNVKTFLLERVVANMDTEWLGGQLRNLVAETDYKGLVTVTFPVTHSRVVIQNPDKVNRFFTSVSTLFSGKSKYEVVKVVWPFSNAKNGERDRVCMVQDEKTWWEEWKDPIKYAVATRRHGWVTNEDKLECIMESKGKGVSIVDWGPDL